MNSFYKLPFIHSTDKIMTYVKGTSPSSISNNNTAEPLTYSVQCAAPVPANASTPAGRTLDSNLPLLQSANPTPWIKALDLSGATARRWTFEEDDLLRKLVERAHGAEPWPSMTRYFVDRTANAIQAKWQKGTGFEWTRKEEEKLRSLVNPAKLEWEVIAMFFP